MLSCIFFYKIAASNYSIYGCARFSNKTKKEGKNIEVIGITAKLKMVQWSDWRSSQEYVSYDEREQLATKWGVKTKNKYYITVIHTVGSTIGHRKCFQFLFTRPKGLF